jgi:hypothetical protein
MRVLHLHWRKNHQLVSPNVIMSIPLFAVLAKMSSSFPPTSALCIFQRRYLLHDLCWYTHRNAPSGNVLGHNRTCRNRTALSNGDTRQNNHMPADPAVIANHDRLRVLDVVAPRLYLRLVCSSHDRHVWSEHHCVADGDETAIQNREVEVGVEAVDQSSAPCACLLLLFLTGRRD